MKHPDQTDAQFQARFQQGQLFASEVSGRSEIEASVSEVWRALIAFEDYEKWNPFTPQVHTDLKIGSPVHLRVVMPGRSTSDRIEWLNRIQPENTLCWGMHIIHPGLLTANRWQILTPLEDGRTEYLTVDKFSGFLAPFVLALYRRPMQIGFQSVADGLKNWIETQN